MDHQHSKVERFTKLGYSHTDIVRVLESLDHDAQTNDILEELIKTGHRQSSNKSASSTGSQPSPKLVPRGCPPTSSNSSPKHSPSRPDSAADRDSSAGFRPVVIDGSNVAMSHGDKKVFSCKGLQLAVKWFWDKGVCDVTVFVPLWRKEQPRPEAPITDQHILHELERRKILVYTPSRCVNGRRVVCYDDRYIVKLAFDLDGIIVSNDNYRDLQTESPQWKKFIEERLLMYTFANDKFMPPDDPLGRNGPTIDDFLHKKAWFVDSKQQHCPYGKKCTYGVKCKFYHPERTNQSQLSVADELRAMSRPAAAERAKPGFFMSTTEPGQGGVDQDARIISPAPYHDLERTVTHPHTYVSSNPTPPPLSNDQSHRASPIEQFVCPRDTGSPGTLWNTGYRRCPSPDVDEAFGSLDSYLSRMHVQDATKSTERLSSYGYSSGVASLFQGSENHFPSGTYGSNTQRQVVSDTYYAPQRALHNGQDHSHNGCDHSHTCDHHSVCGQCRYASPHIHRPRFVQHPPRGSCPSLHPHNSDNHAIPHDKQHFQSLITKRQSHSLPDDHWGRGGTCDAGLTTRVQTPNGEQRKNMRSQLSTLFPQSVVDHIMALYPHVVDMSQLITLIQRYRAGQSQFAF